jgi:hypothetical protein
MPLPLIPIIITGIVSLGIIALVLLEWSRIVDWFKGRQSLKQEDKNNIAFTLKQEMEKGKIPVVQGIFNTETEEVLDGVKYVAKELDETLENHHRGQPLVIYS